MVPWICNFFTWEDWRIASNVCRRWAADLLTADSVQRVYALNPVVPRDLRSEIWLLVLGDPRIYMSDAAFERCKLHSLSYMKNMRDIQKDTGRTFSRFSGFDVIMQMKLEECLTCTLFKAPVLTEYCQGMNYIAAFMLLVTNGRTRTSSEILFQWLFRRRNIKRFHSSFALVKNECRIVEEYIKDHTPLLQRYLTRWHLSIELFAFTWHLLLYVYDLQQNPELFGVIVELWDTIIIAEDSCQSAALLQTTAFILMHVEEYLATFDQNKLGEETFMKIVKEAPGHVFKKYRQRPGCFMRDVMSHWKPRVENSGVPTPPAGSPLLCRQSTFFCQNDRPEDPPSPSRRLAQRVANAMHPGSFKIHRTY